MENQEIKIQNFDINKVEIISDMAKLLKKHVVSQNLFTNIKGKNYVEVEGWQFAGGLLGFLPKVVRVENFSNEKEIKWFAEVEICKINDGSVVSRGFAICSNKEGNKKSFDEYAILSMAQTRAIGKAYRTILSWVMKMAGYEGTPAEEMTEKSSKNNIDIDVDLVEKTLLEIENITNEKDLNNKFNSLTKELKSNKEVLLKFKEIKSLIIEAKKNEIV